MFGRWCVVINQCRAVGLVRCGMTTTRLEPVRCNAPADVAGQCGAGNDVGEGHVQREDGHESGGGNGPHHAVLECPRADAMHGLHHDRRDGGLDAVEQSRHQGRVAVGDVEPRQQDQEAQPRQQKQGARHNASPGTVHEPAHVGGQLLPFRTRQQHAVVERVQETAFTDPAALFDQFPA